MAADGLKEAQRLCEAARTAVQDAEMARGIALEAEDRYLWHCIMQGIEANPQIRQELATLSSIQEREFQRALTHLYLRQKIYASLFEGHSLNGLKKEGGASLDARVRQD